MIYDPAKSESVIEWKNTCKDLFLDTSKQLTNFIFSTPYDPPNTLYVTIFYNVKGIGESKQKSMLLCHNIQKTDPYFFYRIVSQYIKDYDYNPKPIISI